MTAEYVRDEANIASPATPENLHQVPSTGDLQFTFTAFNNDGTNAATIKASISTSTGVHGVHRLCPNDHVIEPLAWYIIDGRIAKANDYIVIEASDVDVTFCLTGRQDA